MDHDQPRKKKAKSPAWNQVHTVRVLRALKRTGRSRGKHLDPGKARDVRDLVRQIAAWGGW